MINLLILILLGAADALGFVTCLAEFFIHMNTPYGRIIRAIRIRLREISLFNFCVTSLLLLFWGAVVGDDNFGGIYTAISMLLLLLFIVHTDDLIDLTPRRRKAALSKLSPISEKTVPLTGEAMKLCELAPLEPIEAKAETIGQNEKD